MTTRVGVREFKTHLGAYLRLVKEGERVVVTERGRPIAEVRAFPKAEAGEAERLRELAALGKLTLPERGDRPRVERVAVAGRSLSETLRDERDDRL